jgi:HSP20 family protein
MSLVKSSNNYPSIFDRFFDTNFYDWTSDNYSTTNTTVPSANIKESAEKFEIHIAAPSFAKNDFKIEVNNNVLTVCSEKEVKNETKEGERFTRKEFSYQSFCRSFSLPNTADTEKITANYENGILAIEIPKKEEAKPKPSKMIEIK